MRVLERQGLLKALCMASIAMALVACGGDNDESNPADTPLAPQTLQAVTPALNVDLGTPVARAAKLRRPVGDANGNAHVGLVVMHPYSSYVDFRGCTDLAARGYTTLCVDSSYTGDQYGYYGYEQHAPAIRAAVNYLRAQSGITKVILFGHSMGGPMMAFYQNVAENGPAGCTGSDKLIPCVTTNLAGLPAADGLILFDSHLGGGLATFTYVDPAILNNTFGSRDPALDMFSAANGYNTTTNGATYTPAFRQRFLAAQAARNQALNQRALQLLADKRAATGDPTQMGDDIPFEVVGATAARLFQPDLGLMQCTQKPQTLLSHDGTRPKQVICSVRPPSGAAAEALSTRSTLNVSVHRWLGALSMRPTASYTQTLNDLSGVDYTSTATTSVGNIPGVTKPLLLVSNGGHYFLRPGEIIFDAAKTNDKTFAITEGAVHGGTECSACETQAGLPTPASTTTFGYYGDTFTRTMDFMAEWMRRRY